MDVNCPFWWTILVPYVYVCDLLAVMLLGISFLQESTNSKRSSGKVSPVERVLSLVIAHTGKGMCLCPDTEPQSSFASLILTIPFLWRLFPYMKEVL